MKIYMEQKLRDFEFWAGARDTIKYLTPEELDKVEEYLDEISPEGMSETEVNDFVWFDCDTIAELLGYDDFDAMMARETKD